MTVPDFVVSDQSNDLRTTSFSPPPEGGGKGEEFRIGAVPEVMKIINGKGFSGLPPESVYPKYFGYNSKSGGYPNWFVYEQDRCNSAPK